MRFSRCALRAARRALRLRSEQSGSVCGAAGSYLGIPRGEVYAGVPCGSCFGFIGVGRLFGWGGWRGEWDGASQAASVAGAALSGVVHGGQNPISGAHVYLFAAASGASGAGAAAYGGSGIAASASNASVSLLTSGTLDQGGGATNGDYYVTTGSDGSFSITGDYSCMPGQQVYLYVLVTLKIFITPAALPSMVPAMCGLRIMAATQPSPSFPAQAWRSPQRPAIKAVGRRIRTVLQLTVLATCGSAVG